jgi:hypothetical protein
MAGATLTTLSECVNTLFPAVVTETQDSVKTPLRDFLPRIPSIGGDSYDWKIHYGGNTSSTTYSESDAVSAAGNETYAALTVAASTGYVRTMVQFTGHAVDAMKGGYFNGVDRELSSAIEHHLHYKEGLLVTALEAAVDSGGSYGGQVRATYKLASYEHNSTPTLAEIQLLIQTLMDNEPAANVQAGWWLMPPDTLFDYLDVAAGVQYFEFNPVVNGAVDAGKLQKMPTINGRPIYVIPGMTSTGTIFLTPEAQAKVVEFRGLQIDQMGKTDDSTVFSITSSEILVVENPRKAGKTT